MSARESIVITARDAVDLGGTLFLPEDPKAVVLVSAATGLRQQFYWSFAEWLTSRGFAAMTFDYRGIGASLNASTVRTSKARKQDWGTHDMPAALDYLVRRFPAMPVHLVGHSAGGQLIGLMPNHRHLSRIVTVASSSGYLQNIAPRLRPIAAIMLKVYIPLFAKLLGFVPTRWIGWGENLPAQVALQWAAWCTKPGYVMNAFGTEITEHFYSEIETPILWLTATDDPIATPENVDDMLRLLENAHVSRRRIDPDDFSLEKIGHVDFFRKRNQKVWPIVTDWMSS